MKGNPEMGYPMMQLASLERIYMTRVRAIKTFFEQDGPGDIKGQKVENKELITMPINDRVELGNACLEALGETLTER